MRRTQGLLSETLSTIGEEAGILTVSLSTELVKLLSEQLYHSGFA